MTEIITIDIIIFLRGKWEFIRVKRPVAKLGVVCMTAENRTINLDNNLFFDNNKMQTAVLVVVKFKVMIFDWARFYLKFIGQIIHAQSIRPP